VQRRGSRRRLQAGLVLPLALLCLLSSCGGKKPPHILLVSVEGLRRSHLGLYGSERRNSPALSELARDCDVFDRAYTTELRAPLAHVAMLSGLYARQFGIEAPLPPSIETLPQRLQRMGYFTIGLVQDGWVHERLGLQRGFDVFLECQRGTEVLARMTEILATRDKGRRVFVFAHVNTNAFEGDPSLLQRFPGPLDEADTAPQAHDDKVRRADELLGSLVDLWQRHELMDRALLMVMGAHGVEAPEDPREGNAKPREESLRVPLLVRWPSTTRPGELRSDFVNQVDLVPTVLKAVGLAGESWLPGCALQQPAPAGRILFAHGSGCAALLRWPWKYVVGEDGETLYNLRQDPFERARIALDNAPEVFFHQRGLLLAQVRRKSAQWPPLPGRKENDEPLLAQFSD
jgi:arylsulfatase A-like enzyme